MRKVSVTSSSPWRFISPVTQGPVCVLWEGELGLCMRQGHCPLVQAAFASLNSRGQYCLWQLSALWHRTCWKQELGVTIESFLQSFVFRLLNCHGNLHQVTSHAAGGPCAMNPLRPVLCSGSKVILGLRWGFCHQRVPSHHVLTWYCPAA